MYRDYIESILAGRPFMEPDSGGQGGYPVANTGNYTNAYTGAVEAFDPVNTMAPQIKEWYNTEALENARNNHIFAQFAKNIPLPEHHGMSVEVRKRNTFDDVPRLTEGVIPDGVKFGYSAKSFGVYEYGAYTPIGSRLQLHAIDPVAQDAAEEMGAAGGNTQDKIARNVALSGSNVMYCQHTDGTSTPVTSRAGLTKDCILTPTMVNRAVTWLKKHKAPKINNKYIAIIHPSVTFDIRENEDWIDAHKYAKPDEIYNGEIGELHGVRFIESDNAKVFKGSPLVTAGQLKVASDVTNAVSIPVTGGTIAANALRNRYVLIGGIKCLCSGNTTSSITISDPITVQAGTLVYPGEGGADGIAVYGCIFLGKDAFGMIDVAGGSMQMIIKTKEQTGGPLEQFGTVGVKFETGGGVLYEERLLRVECGSDYSDVDEDEDAIA
jgi:N4-gp56 family major capsid protein